MSISNIMAPCTCNTHGKKCILLVGKIKKKISSTRAPKAVVIPVSTVNVMSLEIPELVSWKADFELAWNSYDPLMSRE